jgi:membrane-associated protease RseP (regulator of RpoE activity)
MANDDEKSNEGLTPESNAPETEGASDAGAGKFTVHVGKLASGTTDDPIAMMLADEEGLTPDIVAIIDGKRYSLDDLEQLAADEDAADSDSIAASSQIRISPLIARFGLDRMARPRMIGAALIGATVLIYGSILFKYLPANRGETPIAKATAPQQPSIAQSESNPPLAIPAETGVALASLVVAPPVPARTIRNPKLLEAKVRDALWMHAFPDIGVSASRKGEIFLAGSVYTLDEVAKIKRVARRIAGVSTVLFLHPDLHAASGPSYFGAVVSSHAEVWGARVDEVIPGSPAEKAGLKAGDVVRAMENHTVANGREFNSLVDNFPPGKRVEIRVARGDSQVYLTARLSDATIVSSR